MGFPQRKSAGRATPAATSSMPDWFTSQQPGWAPLGLDVMRNLLRICTSVEAQIVLSIIDHTIGDYQNGRPEWAVVSYDDFREMGVEVSDTAIAKALAVLADGSLPGKEKGEIEGKNLIQARKCDKNGLLREYRVLYRNFPKTERREPKTQQRLPVVAKPGQQRQPLGYRQPLQITPATPAQTVEICRQTNGELPLEFSCSEHGNVLKVSLFMPETKGSNSTPVELPEQTDSTPVKSVPRGPRGTKSAAAPNPAVMDVIGPLFVNYFGKPLDLDFAAKITERLGTASPDGLAALIHIRKPRQSGMVLNLADDARAAHEKRVQQQRPRIVEPAAPAFDPEAYSSQSPWARIRARLKATLLPQEFENWFHRTHFSAFKNGEMVVRVPDEVTKAFLEQEYGERILAAAWELDIEVKKFRWLPPQKGEEKAEAVGV